MSGRRPVVKLIAESIHNIIKTCFTDPTEWDKDRTIVIIE
jgi:hypothetical protein